MGIPTTTILSIAQTCARRLLLPVPSSFVTSTSNNMVLLQSLILKTIEDLVDSYEWPELIKDFSFTLIDGQEAYPLPGDYDRKSNETLWNQSQHWPLIGPLDPVAWQTYKSGIISTFPRQRFRVKGIGNNQFFIDPTPDSDSSGQTCVYEYISQSGIRPKTWVANTAYTASTSYVFYNGLTLLCSTSGTSANTGQPPVYGIDNTVMWEPIPDYVASQVYYEGQYVYANSKVYRVTTAGLSSAGTPSVASGSETLGTVVFAFESSAAAWVGGTSYSEGDYSSANSHAYKCTASGVSGRLSPKFYSVLPTANGYPPNTLTRRIADGTAVWTVYEQPYTTFGADTDIVLLQPSLVIDGAVWRFKMERGLDFEELRAESDRQVEIAKTKLIGATIATFNSRYGYPFGIGPWSYPEANYGSDS